MTAAVVAEGSGAVVAVDGPRVLVLDRDIRGLATARFVFAIIAVIVTANGVIMNFVPDVPRVIAVVFLAVGLLAGAATWAVWQRISRRRAAPPESLRLVAAFDRQAGVLYDHAGTPVAPLAHVQVNRRMQLASSSPAVWAEAPEGRLLLARGNPFLGGLRNLDGAIQGALHQP